MEPITPVTLRLAGLVEDIAREVQSVTGSAALAECARFAPVYFLLVFPVFCLLRVVWREGGRQLIRSFAGSIYCFILLAFAFAAWLPLDILFRPPLIDPPSRLPRGARIESCYASSSWRSEAGAFLEGFRALENENELEIFIERRNLTRVHRTCHGAVDVELLKQCGGGQSHFNLHIVVFTHNKIRKAMVLRSWFHMDDIGLQEDLFLWKNERWNQTRSTRSSLSGYTTNNERRNFCIVLLSVAAPVLLFVLVFFKLAFYRSVPASSPLAIPWIPICLTLSASSLALWSVSLFICGPEYANNSYFYVPLSAGLVQYIAFRLSSAGAAPARV